MAAHARVMPSALHLTVPCPGSLQLQERVPPSPPTREQAEGEAGHLVARKHGAGEGAMWGLGRKFETAGLPWEVDSDMIDGALIYAGEVTAAGRFEDPVNIPDVHPTNCWGTPDFWYYSSHNILRVVDYKYGHRYVEVFRHYQLIAYAAGVARFLNLPAETVVVLVIVQPRNYSHGAVRRWETTVGEVIEICHRDIFPAVNKALGPNPPTKTGRHCLDCRARHACATLQRADESIVDFSETAELAVMPNESVGAELRILAEAIKLLEARYTGLYEQASNIARSGVPVRWWQMESGHGKYTWLPDTTVEQITAMGDLLGVNVRQPPKLLTPTQAVKNGIDEGIISQYAHRPRGALRLVQDDTTAFRKIFGANKT